MAQRILKNLSDKSYTLDDLGGVEVPSNGAVDLGGDEKRLIELASSADLLALLGMGADKFVISDGTRDYAFLEGIDMILRISMPTQVDKNGRWMVRSDSRRQDYDVNFIGIGDGPEGIAKGTVLRWDFSEPDGFVDAPEGWKRKVVKFSFNDPVYIKEGAIYFYNAPKKSYLDFYFTVPQGYPYIKKGMDPITYDVVWGDIVFAPVDTIIGHWASHFLMEGTCPMGDELNTEAAHEIPTPAYVQFSCEVTVPDVEGWEEFHGHFCLEVYRARTIEF
jgi:hypothetical protein